MLNAGTAIHGGGNEIESYLYRTRAFPTLPPSDQCTFVYTCDGVFHLLPMSIKYFATSTS